MPVSVRVPHGPVTQTPPMPGRGPYPAVRRNTMRVILALPVVLLLVLPASAQQFVYPRADASKITVHRDLEHKSADGRTTRFDLYRPAGSEIVPIVITCNVGNGDMRRWPGYI